MESATWAAWFAATGTVLGVFGALGGLWWQQRRQWLLHSAAMITQLLDRFDSTEFMVHRAHAADAIAGHVNNERAIDLSDPLCVMPFLENVGYLTRRGALDLGMVWNKFGWVVTAYYFGLTWQGNPLAAIREKEQDEAIWSEFEWLADRCLALDRKRGVPVDERNFRKMRIEQVLRWEGQLNKGTCPGGDVPPRMSF